MSVPEKEHLTSAAQTEESEDESEVLEESPCGRWQKRKEQMNQGNVPGIESAFLAMDTEEGVEVIWNEVQFKDKKIFKQHEESIITMFDKLLLLEHPNIVKFHKYWLDILENSARVVFITEYMSSGSLKQFLKKTKKNHKTMNAKTLKRWCTQILSALSYLHSCDAPIIHGNLTCDTIFIQHNGLIKIGSVWHRIFANAFAETLPIPSLSQEEEKNLHFFPPEFGSKYDNPAFDIFSFGICALEMAMLEIQGNEDCRISKDAIMQACRSLEDSLMMEFILKCLSSDPQQRPTAHDLLFHRVLFEVHSLKLLAAHSFLNNQNSIPDNVVEEMTKPKDPNAVGAEICHRGSQVIQWRYSNVPTLELDKFIEDVRNGIYPLMNFATPQPPHLARSFLHPLEGTDNVRVPTPDPIEMETRKIVQIQCTLESNAESSRLHLTLLLKMEDKLHRQLTCDVLPSDNSTDLAAELVHYGFINEDDCEKLANFLEEVINRQQFNGTSHSYVLTTMH
ncbi:nuclear receptor-binding protein 2 isoform X1 [Protopterus annectens]|uniref:nuclear receptor-binding protein 2 isoform X1 n=1 Tax=Protopterus annectens TaxID=7888 RepID=UPI001CFC3C6F|nr:nuclear receptor-binding protein 2 isoform X1 [Protopterus annectens]